MVKIFAVISILILAILILAGNTFAKETSINVGDWHLSLNTSCPLYTSIENHPPENVNGVGFYIVTINKTPYVSTDLASIMVFYSNLPAPNKQELRDYAKDLFTRFNQSPTLTDYEIDGQSGIMGMGWSNESGKIVYGVIAPSKSAKLIGFLSLLDKRTSFEIIDSLHVESSDSSSSSQPIQIRRTASGTRDDPLPMGTTIDLGDGWQITVLSVIPDATNVVMKENMFNQPPKAGDQFFLAKVRATYLGAGSSKFDGSYRLRAVGPSSVGYSTFDNFPGVIPNPLPDSEVFTGGSIEGYVGWEIRSRDVDKLVMYDSPPTFGEANRLYMALFGGPIGSTSFSTDKEWAEKGYWKMGRY